MDEGKELLDGFNAGYVIRKHRPELSRKLVVAVERSDIPFIEGFIAGTEEYAKERSRNKIINKLRDISQRQPKAPSKGKSKGDKSMDIDR